jgi:Peptidase inhibitor family I36
VTVTERNPNRRQENLMRNKWIIGTLAAVATAAAIAPAGAFAATAPPCSTDQSICLFGGRGETGPSVRLPELVTNSFKIDNLLTTHYADGPIVGNTASSYINNSDRPLYVWTGVNQKSSTGNITVNLRLAPHSQGDFPSAFDNKVVSALGEPPLGLCDSGAICTFSNRGGTGFKALPDGLVTAPFKIPNLADQSFPGGLSLANQISSVINNTQNALHMWSGVNETGAAITVDAHSSWDFGAGQGALNDATQSADTKLHLNPLPPPQ